MAARTSSGVDRISHLPDSLLREIVYRLPAKDAARTALLAARWRGVWRSPAAPAPARWASTLAAAGRPWRRHSVEHLVCSVDEWCAAALRGWRRPPAGERRHGAQRRRQGLARWRRIGGGKRRRRRGGRRRGRRTVYIPAPETGTGATGARAERSGAWTKAMVTAMDCCGVARFTATAWRVVARARVRGEGFGGNFARAAK
ncbi:hypothetical protein QYE76_039885 [Lolium multiflorum]|uniref:F-box domain-containing protein n=1 Tax=Lolium multiflorum TaxID=4521 RepID=A0AAD8WS72_LOLMU|nr:hypothetical protein QYE76_039885 [Lolium multiflorum]